MYILVVINVVSEPKTIPGPYALILWPPQANVPANPDVENPSQLTKEVTVIVPPPDEPLIYT